MLTQQQYDILTQIVSKQIEPSKVDPQTLLELNIDSVSNLMNRAKELLAPYRVKRAIFLAAGVGNRLRPITINTPKPLVRVNGKRMIETLLDAVTNAGIEDIIIVRGHLKEQFDVLKSKYPTIKFIDNPYFNTQNNISSAVLIKDYIENAYIMEADLVLKNQNLITPYQYRSNYLGVYTRETNDWCFETKESQITKISLGGKNCHHMFGVSYWDEADGKRLQGDLQKLYDSEGGTQKFWDFAALENNIESYSIFVRECTFDDIQEIDGLDELKQIDKAYA